MTNKCPVCANALVEVVINHSCQYLYCRECKEELISLEKKVPKSKLPDWDYPPEFHTDSSKKWHREYLCDYYEEDESEDEHLLDALAYTYKK